MNHHAIQDAMERAVRGGEPLDAQTLQHASVCPECGGAWDRLSAAERVFEGTDGLSARSLAALEARILASVPPAPARAPWWSLDRWLVAIPALAVAAVLLSVVIRPLPGPGFTARGMRPAATQDAWVRVLCVSPDGVTGEARSVEHQAQLACGRQDVLAFSVHLSSGARWRSLFLVGLAPDGELRFYHPRPPETFSVSLPPAPLTDHTLDGVRLGVNHGSGVTRIAAIFSSGPVPLDGVRQAISSGNMEETLGPDTLVQTVELHIP